MEADRPITVLLAEEKARFRELFRPTLLALGCDVVAEAGSHTEAVRLYIEHRPDLVLTNFRLSAGTGLDVIKDIMAIEPNAKIIMLTSHGDEYTRRACMDAGASGFIIKNRPIVDLIEAPADQLPLPAAA